MPKNRLFQQCLASVLRSSDTLEVLELEHEDEGLLDYLRTEKPDMALIDLGLPGNKGILLTQFINECNWVMKAIVIVSAFSQDRLVECIAAGAHAWLYEDSSMDELGQAIEDVREGRVFYSSTVVHSLFGKFAQLAQDDRAQQRVRSTSLTQREPEILDLISQRLTNKKRFFTEFREQFEHAKVVPAGPSIVAHQFTGGTRIAWLSVESRGDD